MMVYLQLKKIFFILNETKMNIFNDKRYDFTKKIDIINH